MTRRRSTLLVLGGLAAVSALTIGAVTPASGDDGNRKVRFEQTTPFTEAEALEVFTADPSRCSFAPDFSVLEPCVVPVTQKSGFDQTVTGDFRGITRGADLAILSVNVDTHPTSLDIPFVEYLKFEGTLTGCGTGSVIFRADGYVQTGDATWQIVPKSGRGGLAGLTGSGTVHTDFSGPGGIQHGVAVGRVRCGKHGHD